MKKKNLFKFVLIAAAAALVCSCMKPDPENPVDPKNPGGSDEPADITSVTSDDFELSYWVDCDMLGYHRRGYWYDYDSTPAEAKPFEDYIRKGCKMLVEQYQANLLYVFYHRQFELATAEEVMKMWLDAAEGLNVKIVPIILLQNYSNTYKPIESALNFSDDELMEFAQWCKANISDEFGVFDVYSRQGAGSPQDSQIKKLWAVFGNKLDFVGLQPGVALDKKFGRGIQDTWTAECQGNTNDLWSKPLNGQNVGKNLLDNWVMERVNGETRPITWDLIPVAWDYEETTSKDRYGYVCPGDNAAYNDPPIIGRLHLCKDAIFALYENKYENPKLGGLSCDLTILQANSNGCGKDKTNFYKAIRSGECYEGYFASAIDEIADVYKAVKEDYLKTTKK